MLKYKFLNFFSQNFINKIVQDIEKKESFS